MPAIAVVAVILMVWAGRASSEQSGPGRGGGSEAKVDAVDAAGLHVGDTVVGWPDVAEVSVVTRRTIRGVWFGLEISAHGTGPLLVDGADGLVEPFLAESHRLAGFDHDAAQVTLAASGARAVCFRR